MRSVAMHAEDDGRVRTGPSHHPARCRAAAFGEVCDFAVVTEWSDAGRFGRDFEYAQGAVDRLKTEAAMRACLK